MWPNHDETLELLGDAQHGDDAATDRLLDRHRESLHKMVRGRLNPGLARRLDASDIVQEALLTASRRLAEYLQSPTMPFHAWLRQLVRDRLADACRRELADKRAVSREQGMCAGDHSSLNPMAYAQDNQLTPAATLLKKEFAQRFYQVLDQLDHDAREIILMRHAEQLTNSQTAEILGISEAAAGMRYLRALRRLKTLLGETPSVWMG